MIDYTVYVMNKKERVICICISMIISSVITYLFYRSIYVLISIVIIYPITEKKFKIMRKKKRKSALTLHFKDCIQMLSSALNAGYSLEKAFVEAYKECLALHGLKSHMTQELRYINAQVQLNNPLEKLLIEFSLRCGVEEIQDFSEVFQFAKRSGGDLLGILNRTAIKISERIEVKGEIEIIMAGKKLEQNVMNVVPVGILFYVNITSPELLAGMYGNVLGIVVMSICLAIYVAAYFLSEIITDIEI